jgi:hypothetical protein
MRRRVRRENKAAGEKAWKERTEAVQSKGGKGEGTRVVLFVRTVLFYMRLWLRRSTHSDGCVHACTILRRRRCVKKEMPLHGYALRPPPVLPPPPAILPFLSFFIYSSFLLSFPYPIKASNGRRRLCRRCTSYTTVAVVTSYNTCSCLCF